MTLGATGASCLKANLLLSCLLIVSFWEAGPRLLERLFDGSVLPILLYSSIGYATFMSDLAVANLPNSRWFLSPPIVLLVNGANFSDSNILFFFFGSFVLAFASYRT